MGVSKSEQKCALPTKITALGCFQSKRLVLCRGSAFTMKDIDVDRVRDENIRRQLKVSPYFRGRFRMSKKRLREIGKKGFEQMEHLPPSEIGEFSE